MNHSAPAFIAIALAFATAAGFTQAPASSTTSVDWSVYRGDPKGNQYAPLAQIHAANVHKLAPVWEYQLRGSIRSCDASKRGSSSIAARSPLVVLTEQDLADMVAYMSCCNDEGGAAIGSPPAQSTIGVRRSRRFHSGAPRRHFEAKPHAIAVSTGE